MADPLRVSRTPAGEDVKGDRVLICGSRTFREGEAIRLWLREFPDDVTVIHGAAKGADSLAGFYAHFRGMNVEEYPADWDQHGKRAGYVRNARMLSEGKPDIVLAFIDKPLEESKGTAMMVDLAHKAGVPVFVTQYLAPRVLSDGPTS